MNQAILIGRLGADPECRGEGDRLVANLRVATDESWKDKSGVKQQKTEWHRVVAWGRLAGTAQRFLKKGARCAVVGKIETRMWEKDGVKKYQTEIRADRIDIIDWPEKGSEQAGGFGSPPARPPDDDNADIPF